MGPITYSQGIWKTRVKVFLGMVSSGDPRRWLKGWMLVTERLDVGDLRKVVGKNFSTGKKRWAKSPGPKNPWDVGFWGVKLTPVLRP